MTERNARKVREGTVVSAKMQKTVVIQVERLVKHPFYSKVVRRRSKMMVDDPEGKCKVGDYIRIQETRPLSKRKRWRYVDTVRSAK
jgi:small subunit ribosomal protein S17